LDDLSRLGLSTHERLPKAFRYIKLNHFFHDPLPDPCEFDGHIQLQIPLQTISSQQ
jgi:hypothetical protein